MNHLCIRRLIPHRIYKRSQLLRQILSLYNGVLSLDFKEHNNNRQMANNHQMKDEINADHKRGLEPYHVDLSEARRPTRRCINLLSIHSYDFRQARDAIIGSIPPIVLFLFASSASIGMGYVYLLSAIEPASSASFALHIDEAAFIWYNIGMAVVAIIAFVIDLAVICGLFNFFDRHGGWLFLLSALFSSLIWWP
jgi:hypothetical protein